MHNYGQYKKRELSWCQLCRHWWHRWLSLWQPASATSDDKVGIVKTLDLHGAHVHIQYIPWNISTRICSVWVYCNVRYEGIRVIMNPCNLFIRDPSVRVVSLAFYYCLRVSEATPKDISKIGWYETHDDVINGNIFRVTGRLCGEFTGPRWISHTKASDAELWCFIWSAPE